MYFIASIAKWSYVGDYSPRENDLKIKHKVLKTKEDLLKYFIEEFIEDKFVNNLSYRLDKGLSKDKIEFELTKIFAKTIKSYKDPLTSSLGEEYISSHLGDGELIYFGFCFDKEVVEINFDHPEYKLLMKISLLKKS